MDGNLQGVIELFRTMYAEHGWLGASPVVVWAVLNTYRQPFIQDRLPPKARYSALPELAKKAIPIVLGGLGGLILALMSGGVGLIPLGSAFVTGALAAGGLSIPIYHGGKGIAGAVKLRVEKPSVPMRAILKTLSPNIDVDAVRVLTVDKPE